jgi:hypothetical protein
MSTSAGGCGAFGLLLRDFPEVAPILEELEATVQALDPDKEEFTYDFANSEAANELSQRFREALSASLGVEIPTEFRLIWTDEDHPAECTVDENEWILGMGIFTNPWNWPVIPEALREKAKFYNWAWIG